MSGGAIDPKLPVRKSIRKLFQSVIDTTLADPTRACMLIVAASERCPKDDAVRQRFCGNAEALEAAFAARLERARKEGELDGRADFRALARTLVTLLFGLQVSARGGTPRATLEQVADTAAALLG
jgi:TetR/AcrR family transcriptional repressor of nem operon